MMQSAHEMAIVTRAQQDEVSGKDSRKQQKAEEDKKYRNRRGQTVKNSASRYVRKARKEKEERENKKGKEEQNLRRTGQKENGFSDDAVCETGRGKKGRK